jgi:hypothetical protein
MLRKFNPPGQKLGSPDIKPMVQKKANAAKLWIFIETVQFCKQFDEES